MAQKPQIVDITKSYLPIDPNAFVQNLVNTDREDGEEKTYPLLPYEGYNFLPTSYGYKSYFGTNSELGLSALPSRCQAVLLYQLPNYKNRLIALCEDGIWVGLGEGIWTHWIQDIVHTYDAAVYEEWTWCVIENVLYMYKQGMNKVYKTTLGTRTITGEVLPPSIYQTFTCTTNALGDGSLDGLTNYEVSAGYYQTTTGDYTQPSFIHGPATAIPNLGFVLNVTGALPDASDIEYYVVIYDGDSGIEFVKRFATLSNQAVNDLTGWSPVSMPSAAQTFTYSNQTGGDGGFDTDPFDVSVQYVKGPIQYVFGIETVGTSVAAAGRSLRIAITGATPAVGTSLRIWLENDTTGDVYYKEVALAATINILSLNECTLITSISPEKPRLTPITLTNDLSIANFTPSFLNMAGQMGIFRAGLRLGFWDSANSVSWSSNLDLTDFTPAVENLAGNTIFGRVVGRIVHCRGHGEGFIIYSTKSIVGVTFSASGNLLWDGKVVLDNTGISFSKAVTCGKNDSEHYVYATSGIYAIGKYNALSSKFDAEPVLTEIYDFLRESRDPVYMSVLQDRYLCFSVIPDDYIGGGNKQSFSTGIANPYLGKIDWYIPTEDHPVDTVGNPATPILPEQSLEILFDLLSGQSSTKRKDGEWVPKWNATVDIMDDRYYSWWRRWAGEQSTRRNYLDYDTFLNTTPLDPSLSDLNTYLNAQRPASPPDAYRFGQLRTSTGIRSFPFFMGADDKENNETLIWGQLSEWDDFIKHQTANIERLESYTETTTTSMTAADFSVTVVGSTATTGAAGVNTITWTLFLDDVQVATGTASYTLSGSNPLIWSLVNWPSFVPFTGVWGDAWWPTFTTLFPLPDARYYLFNGQTVYGNGHSTNPWQAIDSSGSWSLVNISGSDSSNTVIGTIISGDGNNEILTTEGPTEYAAKEVIVRRTFNKGYEITKRVTTSLDTVNRITIVSYHTALTTANLGYSQFRAVVTHWDRVKFGLYGNFEILETVPAEAMTAKIWDSVYPQDQGTSRNQIISYGGYKAISPFNLKDGTIGSRVVAPNPNGTDITDVTGYDREGITSLHTEFTLPGASFLLQQGSITDVYPTFVGAFVYDLHLKKWGKYKGEHKLLLESTPINTAINGSVTYTDLGANAGILDTTGAIKIFDSAPLDSWIRYGKIGYYRLGFSDLVEVKASMRIPSTFIITSESSMDGKLLDLNKNTESFFTDEVVAECFIDVSARWHTVKISGNYDLTGLEVRATLSGRR